MQVVYVKVQNLYSKLFSYVSAILLGGPASCTHGTLTNQQRERHMNTIQVTQDGMVINYTESEVLRYVQQFTETAKELDAIKQIANKHWNDIREMRNEVRDFFSEGEWQDGEQSVSKTDVNELLDRIGAQKITTIYGGSFTITGTFSNVDAEDEDEARRIVTEEIDVNFNPGDISVDDITVDEIDENY